MCVAHAQLESEAGVFGDVEHDRLALSSDVEPIGESRDPQAFALPVGNRLVPDSHHDVVVGEVHDDIDGRIEFALHT